MSELISGENTTVYDQETENGCVSISGMGYYVPLDNFVNLEVENNSLKEKLVKEMSRNAFVEVTGKSIAEIRADAINEMLDNLDAQYKAILTVDSIKKYADKLIEEQ